MAEAVPGTIGQPDAPSSRRLLPGLQPGLARPRADSALPPLWLLAAACALWGFNSGSELVAALALTLVVLTPALGMRMVLAAPTQTRLFFVVIAFFAGWVLLRFLDQGPSAIYRVLGGLPALLAALVWLQLQSPSERLPWQVLAPALARRPPTPATTPAGGIDLRPAFFLVCLVAAGVEPEIGEAGWLALSALLLALWLLLPRLAEGPARITACLAALFLAIGLQVAVIAAMRSAFQWLETQLFALIDDGQRRVDPLRSETRIGSIARLKQRQTIELRVDVPPGWAVPMRLTEAVYDQYRFGTWAATQTTFQSIDRSDTDTPFLFDPGLRKHELPDPDTQAVAAPLTILDYLAEETVALAVPLAAAGVQSRALLGLSGNPLGSLRADGRPGHQRYRVLPGSRRLASPGDEDLRLPDFLAAPLRARARALGLEGLSTEVAVLRLMEHFRTGFRYSLEPPPYRTGQALLDFLDEHRSGHCEYFATAGTLLLRAAGIPSRYAVGFWLGEWDSTLDSFVARTSHAHAWTLVWNGTSWQEVDFTPAAALSAEGDDALLAKRWASLLAWLGLAWHGEVQGTDVDAVEESGTAADWPWLLAVLALSALLGWLRWRGRPHRPLQDPARLANDGLAALMDRLAGSPLGPRPAECVSTWLTRLRAVAGLEECLVQEIIELHAQTRYAAVGHGVAMTAALDARTARLAERLLAASRADRRGKAPLPLEAPPETPRPPGGRLG